MSELISEESATESAFRLGEILGTRRAFSSVAGRCSAADAACIRRIRDEKLYTHRAETWDEFCPKFLGMSRANANRVIGYLEEFGPDYFELAQLTRIGPTEFRAIAPSVKDNAVHWQGEAIALIPQNSAKITAAIDGLRKTVAPAAERKTTRTRGIAALKRSCNQVVVDFGDVCGEPVAATDDVDPWAIITEMLDRLKVLPPRG